MSSNIEVKFKFDTGWYNISDKTRIKDFFVEKHMYKSLKPVTDICRFKIKYDQLILSKLLLATYDIEAIITKNGQPYFKGVVKPSYTMKSKARVEWVEVQLDDNGFKLDKSVNEDFVLTNVYLCNYQVVSSATENGTKNSLVHYLLYKAGYDSSAFDYPILATHNSSPIYLSFFTHLKNEPNTDNKALSKVPYGGSYKELLTNILFQYGYVYYFDEAGRMRLFNFRDTNVVATKTVNNTNLIDTLTVQKNEPTYDAVEISWYGKEDVKDVQLYGFDIDNLEVKAGEYFPETSNATTMTEVYYNVDITTEQGKKSAEDIIAITNTRLDPEYHGFDTVETVVERVWVEANTRVYDWGWKLIDSYEIYTWFPIKPSWVNDKTIRATYLKYECRGFLCTKDGHKWRIDTYAYTQLDTYVIKDEGYWKETTKTLPGPTIQANVLEEKQWLPLSFKLRIKNQSLLYPMYIRKLRAYGDVIFRSALNIVRENYTPYTERMLKYKANYIYDTDYASLLAESLQSYFDQSSYTYDGKCTEDLKVGDWVLLTDNNFQNVNNFPVENKRCLVVSVRENEFTGDKTYSFEQYKDVV